MRTKRRILFAVLLVAVVCLIAWLVLRSNNSEPIYQGRRLSYWLQGYEPGSRSPTPYEANEAVRKIGTNSIPTLLRFLRKTDSKFRVALASLIAKQHIFKKNLKLAEVYNYEAILGIQALGPMASNAVPDLIKIYQENRVTPFNNKLTVSQLFAEIGPGAKDAIPVLIADAASSNLVLRSGAVWTLGQLHSDPQTVVPVLAQSLRDSTANVRGTAANGLAAFGPAAKSAVPELILAAMNKDAFTHTAVLKALQLIDPVAAANLK
jgi:hypothetical protein